MFKKQKKFFSHLSLVLIMFKLLKNKKADKTKKQKQNELFFRNKSRNTQKSWHMFGTLRIRRAKNGRAKLARERPKRRQAALPILMPLLPLLEWERALR